MIYRTAEGDAERIAQSVQLTDNTAVALAQCHNGTTSPRPVTHRTAQLRDRSKHVRNMAGSLIIAFGNPLRCDDGLAWRAAEELSHLALHARIMRCHELTPDLALPVSEASTVVFVDAARDGDPGTLKGRPLHPEKQSSAFSHEFSPGSILSLAHELYNARPKAFVISICGECFDHGEKLSPKVMDTLPKLVALVEQILGREPQPTSHSA